MNFQIKFRISSHLLCSLLMVLCIVSSQLRDGGTEASTLAESLASNEELNLTTLQLVQLRGFKAVNHYVNTTDGYSLNVVRCTNPLINRGESGLANKDVVLFDHGTATDASFFIVNSIGAHPIDYSKLDIKSKSQEELIEMFKNDPNKKSLPLLLLNLGHEVWLLNRRGTYQSEGTSDQNVRTTANDQKPLGDSKTRPKMSLPPTLPDPPSEISSDSNETLMKNPLVTNFINTAKTDLINLPRTFDTNYWNFSMDQQILIDLPQVIDYILEVSNRQKLAYVGHSVGGALIIAALSELPELNDKLSVVLAWAPAIYATSFRDQVASFILKPIFSSYVGPFFPTFVNPLVHDLIDILCQIPFTQATLCATANSVLFGYGGEQQSILPGTGTALLDTFSSPTLLQLLQVVEKGKMHHFDYGSTSRNMIAYGTPTPPLYNVSKITYPKLTIWGGSTDGLVPIERLKLVIDDMTVKPAEVVFIDKPGVLFNHASNALHVNVAELLNIPSLKTLYTIGDSH